MSFCTLSLASCSLTQARAESFLAAADMAVKMGQPAAAVTEYDTLCYWVEDGLVLLTTYNLQLTTYYLPLATCYWPLTGSVLLAACYLHFLLAGWRTAQCYRVRVVCLTCVNLSSSLQLPSIIFIQVPPLPADVQKALERKRDATRKLSNNEYSI